MEIKEIEYPTHKTHLSFYRESNTSFAMNDSEESYTTQDIANLVKKRLDAMMANPDNRSLSVSVTFEECKE